VTDNALKKIRSAMVKENVSPEQGGLVSACRAADVWLSYNVRFIRNRAKRDVCFSSETSAFLSTQSLHLSSWHDARLQETLMQQGFVFVTQLEPSPAAAAVLSRRGSVAARPRRVC